MEDGEIIEDEKEKVACLRTPDNVMVSIVQELTEDKILALGQNDFGDRKPNQHRKGGDAEEEDANMIEIKNILRNIKI